MGSLEIIMIFLISKPSLIKVIYFLNNKMDKEKIKNELKKIRKDMSICYPNKANFNHIYIRLWKIVDKIEDEVKQERIEDNWYYPDDEPFINNNISKC